MPSRVSRSIRTPEELAGTVRTDELRCSRPVALPRSPGQRLLGLDVGAKTIGLALSDITWSVASPVRTLPRSRLIKDVEAMRVLVHELEVERASDRASGRDEWTRRFALPVGSAVRAQSRVRVTPSNRVVGRTAFDGGSRAVPDRGRPEPRTSSGSHRPGGRRLDPAGGARCDTPFSTSRNDRKRSMTGHYTGSGRSTC